ARSLIPYLADTVPGWFQAVLTLYNAEGVEVAYDDDYRFDPDPVLIYTVPQNGDYTLSVRDSIYRGREDFVYRISIGETPFIEQIFPLGGTINSELDVSLSGANLPVKKMKMRTGDDASGVQQVRVANDGVFSNARDFGISSLPSSLEREPNNLFTQAQAVTNSTVIDGRIASPGDQDWFSFKGNKGDDANVEVSARRLGSPLDAKLVLLDAQRKELAASDDAEDKSYGLLTHHADSRINFKLPETGTYFVRLTDLQGKGGPEYAYRLRIGEEQPDFQLRIVPSSLRVPRNGTAIATVHAIRTGGFAGEINLSVLNAPEGIELQRATIPAGVDSARIVIAAGSRAQEQMTALDIEGAANLGWQTSRHRAVPAEDMMQAFIYRHLVTSQQLLVQITEPAEATVALDLPRDGVFRARPGSKIILNSTVKWLSRPRKGVRLTLAEPPEWLALKTSSLTARGGEIMFEVSPNAEPGDKATVLLNGTVRIEKLPEDPDYNPIEKFKNSQAIDFTIDAISVEIIN
ncbi:MAG: PPC domain-containing protein, partial [Verrucomicrobia bacterium]|nr:PPC domain-containing protein [Verrucomicrobiota bacterium]